MNRTDQNRSGVNGILNRTRTYNSEIGIYQEHFINEEFQFAVSLSNGWIVIPLEMAQDQEVQPSSISEERIQRVAQRFQSNYPSPQKHSEEKKNLKSPEMLPKLNLWQKFLRIFGLK